MTGSPPVTRSPSRTYIDSESVCGPAYTGLCEFVDLGSGGVFPAPPDDHGGLYDFGFGAVAPGESKVFSVLYGAAPGETEAVAELGKVGAQLYSLGQSSCEGDDDRHLLHRHRRRGPLAGQAGHVHVRFQYRVGRPRAGQDGLC